MNNTIFVVLAANSSWYLYNFRKNTIVKFLSLGYRVMTVAPRDDYSHRLEEMGCVHKDMYIACYGVNPINEIRTIVQYFLVYRNWRPSIVFNFTPKCVIYNGLTATIFRVPVVNNISGLGKIFSNRSSITHLVKILYKISNLKACRIYFQNTHDKEIFVHSNIARESQIKMIPGSGVDLERFQVIEKANRSCTKFLFASRLIVEKGIKCYLDAAVEMSDRHGELVQFVVAGDIPAGNPSSVGIEDLKKYGDICNLVYVGNSDYIERLLADVDCLVLPSFYGEGVPKILLEGCATGTPIITTDNVGCCDVVVDGENGYVCAANSVSSLIECMEKLLFTNSSERKNLGDNGRRKVVSKFDESLVIHEYMECVRIFAR